MFYRFFTCEGAKYYIGVEQRDSIPKGEYEDKVFMLRQHQRIGNYVPKTKELKLCAIFEKRGFFDMPAEDVEVYGGIEQIPYEDGVVY